jgi:hypothetical protein
MINHTLFCLASLAAGAFIGLAFGAIQESAARKNQRLYGMGKLDSGWAVMPGSMRRTAAFLAVLAAVQFFCPLLFADGCQWWVSGGIALGYGACLFKQLRRRISANRN